MENKIGRMFVWAKILESVATAWSISTYVLFLQSLGLSLLEVNLINTFFMATSSILDPFTGNWGDRIGQKKVYLFGVAAWGLGHIWYFGARGFWACVVAEIICAVGQACKSEALESWMKNHCSERVTHRALARSGVWSRLAIIPTAILGGIVGSRWGLQWPWLLAGIASLVSMFLVTWQLRKFSEEPQEHKPGENDLQLWVIAKKAWSDPVLRRSFLLTAMLSACFQPFNMFWPVVFKNASGSSEWLGSVWIGVALASALGSRLAENWKIDSRALAVIIASIGLPMIIPQFKGNWMVLILIPFLLHEVGRSMWLPVLWSYTNRRIEGRTRTSVNSLRSSAGTMGAVGGLLVSGVLTEIVVPTGVWGISAIALILISAWVYRWNHK